MINTLIVVDVPFYREGLQAILSQGGEIEVVGAVSTARDAEAIAAAKLAHIVLLDINAAEAREVLARLQQQKSAPKVVALAVSETPQDVLSWAEAGVAGYVPRTASSSDLIRTLKD